MTLLTFRFRQSRSDELPWLIELAKRGTFKELALTPKQIIYETFFNLGDPLQLGHALSLTTALVHHKTAEAFVDRQSLALPMVREVLRCFQQSQQVVDGQAYCWFKTHLDAVLMQPLLLPCRLAARESYQIHPDQPGTITQQVDAALLRAGTRWCPRLADLMEWQRAAGLLTLRAL